MSFLLSFWRHHRHLTLLHTKVADNHLKNTICLPKNQTPPIEMSDFQQEVSWGELRWVELRLGVCHEHQWHMRERQEYSEKELN